MTDQPLCTILSGIQQLLGINLVPDQCPQGETTARFTLIIVIVTTIALLFR